MHFSCVSLNANELLLPTPFPEEGVGLCSLCRIWSYGNN